MRIGIPQESEALFQRKTSHYSMELQIQSSATVPNLLFQLRCVLLAKFDSTANALLFEATAADKLRVLSVMSDFKAQQSFNFDGKRCFLQDELLKIESGGANNSATVLKFTQQPSCLAVAPPVVAISFSNQIELFHFVTGEVLGRIVLNSAPQALAFTSLASISRSMTAGGGR